jgi:hypothetical protein
MGFEPEWGRNQMGSEPTLEIVENARQLVAKSISLC